MSIRKLPVPFHVLLAAIAVLSGPCVLGAPPVPFLDDNEPGLQMLFSGDPNTTESSIDSEDGLLKPDCGLGAPRAGAGGDGGKMHNDFLLCENWDFSAKDWGQASFLQGAFILGESPFSDDGGFECSGNMGTGGYNPCVNTTIRAVTTFKNQSVPNQNEAHKMSEDRDWVLRFDFKITFPAGQTFGGDKLFEINQATPSQSETPRRGDDTMLVFANGTAGSFGPQGKHTYAVYHGTCAAIDDCGSSDTVTPIDKQLDEGTITLHYDADERNYNLWHDNDLLVADFDSFNDRYDASFIQIGGGGSSGFENAIYDNIIWGVVNEIGICGPDGPGTNPPGDFNCDGVVDVADLGIIGANFNGVGVTYVDGDANGDGGVDVADLGIIGANWSSVSQVSDAQGAGLDAFVPEPTPLSLLAMSVLLVRRRRR